MKKNKNNFFFLSFSFAHDPHIRPGVARMINDYLNDGFYKIH